MRILITIDCPEHLGDIAKLRQLLKHMLRSWGIKCSGIDPVKETAQYNSATSGDSPAVTSG